MLGEFPGSEVRMARYGNSNRSGIALLGVILIIIVGAALFAGGLWLGSDLTNRWYRRRINDLEARNQITQTRLNLLRVTRRMARLDIDQPQRIGGVVHHRFQFQETLNGEPIGPVQTAVLRGDRVHIQAFVIRFDDANLTDGDPLAGSSILLFRRMYTNAVAPERGQRLDAIGVRPTGYAPISRNAPIPRPLAFETDLFTRIWQIAEDPAELRRLGINAAHSQAPGVPVTTNVYYEVELSAVGGLVLRSVQRASRAAAIHTPGFEGIVQTAELAPTAAPSVPSIHPGVQAGPADLQLLGHQAAH